MNQDSLLVFPCQLPIKVMGEAQAELDTLVLQILGEHVADISQVQIHSRASQHGRYVAITAIITATHKQQVDAIYQALSAHPKILMAL